MESLTNDSYISMINELTEDEKIQYLFSRIPSASINAFKNTLNYKANKEYNSSSLMLPNNLFALIESSLKENGFIRTYKIYNKQFSQLQDFFGLETKSITDNLKDLMSVNSQTKYKAVEFFKNIFRNYNSQFKGQYIKKYYQDKLNNLKKECEKLNKDSYNISDVKINYSFKDFFEDMKKTDPLFIFQYHKQLEDVTVWYVDDNKKIIDALDNGISFDDFLKILGIYEPIDYDKDYLKNQKRLNRLNNNFRPLFNNNSLEYKKKLVEYINGLVNGNLDENLVKEIKTSDKINVNICYKVLKKINGKVVLNDDIVFVADLNVNSNKNEKYKEYKEQLKRAREFLKFIYKRYNEARQEQIETEYAKNEFEQTTDTIFDDDNYIIPYEAYIKDNFSSKTKEIIDGIDKQKLYNLSPYELDCLNSWLNSEFLLFSYLIGNISDKELLTIINNFSSLLSYLHQSNKNVDNFEELLKIANTFRFVKDIDVALIGYENLIKIINYNQFSGVDVTDETIKNRLKKARYLMINAEALNKSSLPFDIQVKKDGLVLSRYLNNDPEILVSGIETKTCYFISVNENDFFFYSLLNKNGFVVKITDEQGNFVARATCFRRNNALMINGIRLKNNEINPTCKEKKDLMHKVVSLIEMMSEKLIYETANDYCPIDYVLCNKAGILEGSEFDSRYEQVDFKLIREPIDIYSDDWQEFVDIGRNNKDLLQETVDMPNKSFTTDFGDNYPLVLIRSRNNMGLLRPSDISLKTEGLTYVRPTTPAKLYTIDEIDNEILSKINRIVALYECLNGNESSQDNFRLIKDISNTVAIILGDDWLKINYNNGDSLLALTNYDNIRYDEIRKYAFIERVAGKVRTKQYVIKKRNLYDTKKD